MRGGSLEKKEKKGLKAVCGCGCHARGTFAEGYTMQFTKKVLQELYDSLGFGSVMKWDADAVEADLRRAAHKLAQEHGIDFYTFTKKLVNFLHRYAIAGRKYVNASKKWFESGVAETYDIEKVVHSIYHNLAGWFIRYYNFDFYLHSSSAEIIKKEVEKALSWAQTHILDYCDNQGFMIYYVKNTMQSYSVHGYTLAGVAASTPRMMYKCKIVIGLLGVQYSVFTHHLYEYPTIAKYILKPPLVQEGRRLYRKIELGDETIVPWMIVAHELAHCVSGYKHGQRATESGRRKVHDKAFVESYLRILRDMSRVQPLIRKYAKI